MNRVDLAVFQWFNGWDGLSDINLVARLSLWFSEYGPALLLSLFALYSLFRSAEPRRMRTTLRLSGLAGLVATGVSILLSVVVYRPRPIAVLPPVDVHILYQDLFESSLDSSFPCLHAVASAACAAGMWRAPSSTARWVFAGMAVLTGINRLIAGHHWPSDIIASWVLGGVVALVVFALAQPLSPVVTWILRRYQRM